MGADNQQERLDTKWISGFVDGEGCFHVGIHKISKMTLKWQVLPEFRIVQHKKNIKILEKIKYVFGFGIITKNHGDRYELRVRKLQDLNKIVEFFKNNSLQTTKKDDFKLFSQVINLMNKKEHLNKRGLRKIAEISYKMNRQIKPKYLKSSETIRPTYESMKI